VVAICRGVVHTSAFISRIFFRVDGGEFQDPEIYMYDISKRVINKTRIFCLCPSGLVYVGGHTIRSRTCWLRSFSDASHLTLRGGIVVVDTTLW